MGGETGGRVLIADDDPDLLKATSTLLKRYGFSVECVDNGHDATVALADASFDVLLADINMPGNRNLELLERSNEGAKLTPIILITAEPSIATAVQAVRSSAIDYITKPYDPEGLVATVRRAVEKGRAIRTVFEVQKDVNHLRQLLGALSDTLDTPGALPIAGLVTPSNGEASVRGLAALNDEERASLSEREKEVLERLIRGDGTTDVAKALFISPHTVRNHLKAVYRKLGVSSRPELMRRLLSRA